VDSLALKYASTITTGELREHLTRLASDEFLGRDTGKEGQKLAAAYLKEQFVKAGIPAVPAPDPSAIREGYYQPFDVVEVRSGTIGIAKNGRTYSYGKEIVYFQEVLQAGRGVDELIYVGDLSKPPKMALEGKAVLLDARPMGTGVNALGTLRTRVEALRAEGVALVMVNMPGLAELISVMHLSDTHMRLADNGTKTSQKESTAQMIIVDEPAMDQLLATTTMAKLRRKKKARPVTVAFELEVKPGEEHLTAENVLAFIEGTDKKDEIVVLTAHYDHVGVQDGVVYNGADDDGTGTVAMIEMAQAFMSAKRDGHGPRRSVLVMPVSGEEKGLLGSRYYSEHPVFPLANTVADINIDMIGRRDSAHASSHPYIYVIGSDRLSNGLHRANEQANSLYTSLDLDYTFNAESDPNRFYYRSDHYNFARKGVPSVFYFSGVHEDYHLPGDDVEKIDFDLLHQRTLLAFHTAWILANQDGRIVVDKPVRP
jgi:hypothetical protein